MATTWRPNCFLGQGTYPTAPAPSRSTRFHKSGSARSRLFFSHQKAVKLQANHQKEIPKLARRPDYERRLLIAEAQDVLAEARRTGENVAEIAARGLKDPQSLSEEEIRAVCASALSQRQE